VNLIARELAKETVRRGTRGFDRNDEDERIQIEIEQRRRNREQSQCGGDREKRQSQKSGELARSDERNRR
jgi:hypothetical protein